MQDKTSSKLAAAVVVVVSYVSLHFFCGLREGYSSMHMETGKSNASNDEEKDGRICAERFYTEKNIKMYTN